MSRKGATYTFLLDQETIAKLVMCIHHVPEIEIPIHEHPEAGFSSLIIRLK